jgi:hypothetical protein
VSTIEKSIASPSPGFMEGVESVTQLDQQITWRASAEVRPDDGDPAI